MSDILSQEEIDRLLNAAASGAVSGGGGGDSDFDESNAGPANAVAGLIVSAANSTLATLIARKAEVTGGYGQTGHATDFDGSVNVVAKANFRSGFSGAVSFVIESAAAATLADLILGGDGVGKTELNDGDEDAIKEIVSQILGNAAPSIGAKAGMEVGFDSPAVTIQKPGALESALGGGKLYVQKCRVKVEDVLDTTVRIVMDGTATASMADSMGEEAPAAAEAPVSRQPMGEPAGQRSTVTQFRPQTMAANAPEIRNIDLILDIEVEVMVRLGNAQMPLREIQKLRPGSIIDLDKDTDALVELVVNDRIIAKGELVVVSSDHFALRVTEIVTQTERIRSLGGE